MPLRSLIANALQARKKYYGGNNWPYPDAVIQN